MKKRIISLSLVLTAPVVIGVLSFYLLLLHNEKKANLSLLTSANVEALSAGGDFSGIIRSCCKNIKYDDYSGKPYSVVYCGNCDIVPVTAAWNEDTCRK